MNRVLVISDNPQLTSVFVELVKEQELKLNAIFDYRYSIVNKSPDLMIALGCKSINIKDESTVAWIISNIDLVFSIHCKQIFPAAVVSSVSCFNVHPGLNPYNRGWYPQVFSIINKKPIGATIHLMNEEVDAGPIVAQKSVVIESYDSSLSLYKKVQEAEIELLSEYIKPIILGAKLDYKYPAYGNYNSISDFLNICNLQLDAVGSLKDHINLLRSLTHGEFNNAFFIDDAGKKIFVKIQLTPDDQK